MEGRVDEEEEEEVLLRRRRLLEGVGDCMGVIWDCLAPPLLPVEILEAFDKRLAAEEGRR
jgi:hypothetical protein